MAMLVVINPVVCGVILMQLNAGETKKDNIVAGVKAMAIVLLVLIVAAMVGKPILNAFGISLEAFKVVGGIVLSYIGLQLMGGSKETKVSEDAHARLTPLIMFAASPGTITMAITLSVVHNEDGLPLNAIIGSVAAVLLSVIIISAMAYFSKPGKSPKQGLFSKFVGLIIVAMGIQFMLDGIKQFFAL